MQPFSRRSILIACGALLWAGAAQADSYPSRAVKVVVPFPPGGSNDILARIVAQKLQDRNRQPFVIYSPPGAGRKIGSVAQATNSNSTVSYAM